MAIKSNKGALSKNPSNQGATSYVPTRPENKAKYDALNPEDQKRYADIRKRQGAAKANEWMNKRGAGAAPVAAEGPTREQQVAEGFQQGAEAYENISNRFQQFDPYQMQQQYQPGFQQNMEQARQNILGQFDRRTGQAFAQERQDFETQMANRGNAPGSQQYQRELQMLTDRQDRARQEAMSAAEAASYNVQEQGFKQAYTTAMAPYEQYSQIQQPYQAGVQAQYVGQENQLQRAFDEAIRRGDRASAEKIAQMSRSGGGGGSQVSSEDTFYDRQVPGLAFGNTPKPNPIGTGIASAVGAVGNVITRTK